jgi:hypothetical protein
MQRYGQFCMCAEALWIQEIKSFFNSMKTLRIVLEHVEFAMYSLELEIKTNRIYFRPTYPIFFHNVSGNTAFFLFGLSILSTISLCHLIGKMYIYISM